MFRVESCLPHDLEPIYSFGWPTFGLQSTQSKRVKCRESNLHGFSSTEEASLNAGQDADEMQVRHRGFNLLHDLRKPG